MIHDCVDIVTRNSNVMPVYGSDDLTNLFIGNYTFEPNHFSKEEI